MAKKQETKTGTKLLIALAILFGLALIGSLLASMILLMSGGERQAMGANVALIPVEGVLLASSDRYAGSGIVTSDLLIEQIERAEEERQIKAVIFLINSPGGSAVASDEVATAIAEMEKPSAAVIREVGASGAYWVATATDHVIANPMSVTGSIGVISSYLSFGRFLEEWNVTYNRLVAGERKDLGTPFRELDEEEQAFLQEKLDRIHGHFIAAVAENREMETAEVEPYADGRLLLGSEALDAGLIDDLGGKQAALDWINTTLRIEPKTILYEQQVSILDVLASLQGEDPLSKLGLETSVPMAR